MRGWNIPITAALIMIILFIGYLVSLPDDQNRESAPDKTPAQKLEPLKEVRDVTPDEILRAPNIEADLVERLPALEPPPLPEIPPKPDRFERPQVISAGVLKIGDKTINLAGIKPVKLNDMCETSSGNHWPCGMFARTAMRKLIRGRPIECDTRTAISDHITTRCRLASFDISAWLVLTGWAEPESGLFSEELQEAKRKQRGIWRKSAP